MRIGTNYVTSHVIGRIKEHWPAAAQSTREQIMILIAAAIELADARGEIVRAPGGNYVPFSWPVLVTSDVSSINEGFLIVRGNVVKTAIVADQSPEVTRYLANRRSNGQVRSEPNSLPIDTSRQPK
jgi:hypothetical protein